MIQTTCPTVARRRDLVEQGYDSHLIAAAVERGELTRTSRGLYAITAGHRKAHIRSSRAAGSERDILSDLGAGIP